MNSSFTIYTIDVPDGPAIPYLDIEPLKPFLAEHNIQYATHTFNLKDPICEALNQDTERMVWRVDPVTGQLTRDVALTRAATIVAYLQSWSLPFPITMETVSTKLHPALVSVIASQIERKVFPNGITDEVFMKLSPSKQADSSERA